MLRVSWGFFSRWFHKLALNVSVRVNHAGRFIKIKLRKKIWENLGNKTMISLFRKVKHWLFNIAFWVLSSTSSTSSKYLHFNRLTSKNKSFFKGLDGLRETWCCSERWRVELQHLGGARTHSASQAKLWQSRTRLHSGQGENLVSSAQETTVKLSPPPDTTWQGFSLQYQGRKQLWRLSVSGSVAVYFSMVENERWHLQLRVFEDDYSCQVPFLPLAETWKRGAQSFEWLDSQRQRQKGREANETDFICFLFSFILNLNWITKWIFMSDQFSVLVWRYWISAFCISPCLPVTLL